MMAKHWWKVLSIVILFYTFTVGMLIPLRPGILEVRPSRINTGEQVQLEVWGYNTRFKEGERELRAWLKLEGDYAIEANNLLIKAENYMILGFEIPAHLPVETKVADASLIINNKVDGASVRPSAVFISQSSINQAQGKAAWRTPINNLHQSKDIHFPFRNILAESIRNTYFHVPFWFAMILIFLGSMVYSVLYLMKGQNVYDMQSVALTEVGIVFGLIGLITGGVWAQYTWGSFWSFDVKQNMSAISLLIYMAYFVLRQSFEDEEKKARISAVYNIFAFAALIPLLFIIPRMTDSLHPGNGGNPGMGGEDLDNTMRMVFYPAIIGWTLLGLWMAQLRFRMERLKMRLYEY